MPIRALLRALLPGLLIACAALWPGFAAASSSPQRLFISGHSLVDEPLPSYLAAIASSLGTPLEWDGQYLVGSSIRERDDGSGWPSAEGGYDALLIAEQHSLLGTLVGNDTVHHLRRYHDRFVAAHPRSRTWFYEPWLDVDDFDDPRRWIDYERQASPIWRCVVERVNTSLAAEARADRLLTLPTGALLAGLVERMAQGYRLPGNGAASTRASLERIFSDRVHLKPLGAYFVALAVYASMFERSPLGAWAPEQVAPETARALQTLAMEIVAAERRSRRALSLSECQSTLQHSFIGLYWGYVRDVRWRQTLGPLRAWLLWARQRVQWHWRLRRDGPDNPFRLEP